MSGRTMVLRRSSRHRTSPTKRVVVVDRIDEDADDSTQQQLLHRKKKPRIDPTFILLEESNDDDDDDVDEHVHQLDKEGALAKVIGSQSILSQEIAHHLFDTHDDEVSSSPVTTTATTTTTTTLLDWTLSSQALLQHDEPPVSLSQLSFLMKAAVALDSDLDEDGVPLNETAFRKRKREEQQAQEEARALAQQAAQLAAKAIASPEISKQLLLSMVFCRTNPRIPPSSWPPRRTTIKEGFFWANYPPLETCLKEYMKEYYDLSVTKCQSKEQQAFNNNMVTIIHDKAKEYGWTFSKTDFTHKILRDRIRCYFKTHIQNARKRLRTMLMNPTKRANTKALIDHLDIIEKTSSSSLKKDHAQQDNQMTTEQQQEITALCNDSEESIEQMALEALKQQQIVGGGGTSCGSEEEAMFPV